jgi:hypothetical protein
LRRIGVVMSLPFANVPLRLFRSTMSKTTGTASVQEMRA